VPVAHQWRVPVRFSIECHPGNGGASNDDYAPANFNDPYDAMAGETAARLRQIRQQQKSTQTINKNFAECSIDDIDMIDCECMFRQIFFH
jgi:hypothetical protein